jgi:hypothetical protein
MAVNDYLDLSPEQVKAIGIIEKLQRLAARNNSPEEAASATAKAQEMLAEYNLTLSMVEANGGDTGKRADEKIRGGQHEFQQDLWRAVARLNYCLYYSTADHEKVWKWEKHGTSFRKVGKTVKVVWNHRVVGRTVNARATMVMAGYLEDAIERLTAEECETRMLKLWGRWARSLREGMVQNIVERLQERRRHLIAEEQRKAEEAAARAHAEGRAGVSTEHALTLSTLAQSEDEANEEFLHPGITARRLKAKQEERERQQRRAEQLAKAEAEYAAWAAANPVEARLEQERQEKMRREEAKREERNAKRRRGRSYSYTSRYKGDEGAYYMGYDKGAKIGLDQQAGQQKPAGYL